MDVTRFLLENGRLLVGLLLLYVIVKYAVKKGMLEAMQVMEQQAEMKGIQAQQPKKEE